MEIEYRGWRIVEEAVDAEAHGFAMTRAFAVYDDLDDPLPVLQNLHWSPNDARLAIDFCMDVFALTRGKKWPTTQTHEFNVAVAYRARFVEVYQALRKVERLLSSEDDGLGEAPADAARKELQWLRQRCLARQ